MGLELSQRNWDELAEMDPLWAVLSDRARQFNRWQLEDFLRTGTAEVEHILDIARGMGLAEAHDACLDFGCGVGRTTRALAGHFDRTVGLDISAKMIGLASSLNADVRGCEFVVHAAPNLQIFGDASFDVVHAAIVLQHVPSTAIVEDYVREFVRVTRPGGAVVFQLPATLPWRNRMQLGRRAWTILRRVGVHPEFLYRRAHLNPISMLAVSPDRVRDIVTAAYGRVVLAESDLDPTPIRTPRYYVAPLCTQRPEPVP